MSARQRDCGHLLVVDDDENLRAHVVGVLREAGYTTTETGLGREAVDLVHQEQPDLVVLEVNLPKPFATEELLARIRVLLRRLAERKGNGHHKPLTMREHEVLKLLADGFDQRQIAERLVISRKTVSTHIERILTKLDVHSRAQAVAAAFRANLVE